MATIRIKYQSDDDGDDLILITCVSAGNRSLLAPAALPFERFIHYGHARRNNEPYMAPLDEMDLEGLHRAAGFRAVRIVPFEEMPGTLTPGHRAWRFPWSAIIAEK